MNKDTYTIVNIFGEEYKLVSKHHESPHIYQIVELLNHKMNKLSKQLPQYSKTKIAILTCLNITDELFNLMKEKNQSADAIEDMIRFIDKTLNEFKTSPTNLNDVAN